MGLTWLRENGYPKAPNTTPSNAEYLAIEQEAKKIYKKKFPSDWSHAKIDLEIWKARKENQEVFSIVLPRFMFS